MSEFATYQQFFSAEEAEGVIAILEANDIPYRFNQSRNAVDKMIGGDTMNEFYELKIPTYEFERATSLMLINTRVNLDELDKDYYLFTFTDEELNNIIANPDEWGRQDYLVAVELLKKRGNTWTTEELQNLRKSKIERLAVPEKTTGDWIMVGYLLAIIGGLGGILWGYTLWKFTKLLPDGRRVYSYSPRDRRHGKIIFISGVITTSAALILRLYRESQLY